jgi:hypothetical protein
MRQPGTRACPTNNQSRVRRTSHSTVGNICLAVLLRVISFRSKFISPRERYASRLGDTRGRSAPPSCHEQVPAGDIEDQTLGAGQIGRCDFAHGYFAEDQLNPMTVIWERFRMGPFSSGAYRPLIAPDLPGLRFASA